MGTKNIILITLLTVILTLGLTGCDFEPYDPCAGEPDSISCYQDQAVNKKDPSYCAKIEAPAGYKNSNPPKDTCYQMVAEETKDPKYCRLMQGGKDSPKKSDCVTNIAKETRNLNSCEILAGKDRKKCIKQVGPLIKTSDIEDMQINVNSKLEELKSDPSNKILKEELANLKKQKDALYNNAPAKVQRVYFRNERKKILEGIEDLDVKSAISKDYIDYRKANKYATPSELLEKMAEIKEQKELMKRLDDKANQLIETLKLNQINFKHNKRYHTVIVKKDNLKL